jgi:hypothetical protein
MVRFASRVDQRKKSAPRFSEALLCDAQMIALINYNKVRVARANHALGVCKPVNVNRDPAAVHEDEVAVSDQPEMVRPVSLDEELFRMPPKTEHFAMTRSELILVHRRRLIRVHIRLARARTRARLIPVYVRSATFDVCLSTYVRTSFRLYLRLALLLRGAHLLPLHRRSSLGVLRLLLRLLWLFRRLA